MGKEAQPLDESMIGLVKKLDREALDLKQVFVFDKEKVRSLLEKRKFWINGK